MMYNNLRESLIIGDTHNGLEPYFYLKYLLTQFPIYQREDRVIALECGQGAFNLILDGLDWWGYLGGYILFTASELLRLAIGTLVIATLGAFASELSERYLFYRTVVPLGLAGDFFAGNQRH